MLEKHLKVKTNPKACKDNIIYFFKYRITVINPCLIRVEKDDSGVFCDKATQSVWFRDFGKVDFKCKITDNYVEIKTEKVTLNVNKSFKKSFALINGKKVDINNKENLFGAYRTLDCTNGCKIIDDRGFPTSTPIQKGLGVCSKNGIAVIDDKNSLILDDDGTLHERKIQQADLYLFMFGNDYKGAVKSIFQIMGKAPLLPKFVFGNWWSRYHAYSDKEYLSLLDGFIKDDIPFTVATIDMDWHYSDDVVDQMNIEKDGKNTAEYGCEYFNENQRKHVGWTGFTWNKNLFPDYKNFLKEIEKRNYKITLNLHPAQGVRYFEKQYNEFAKSLGIKPDGKQIPFDIADDNFINSYFKILLKPYEKDGVSFWWIDWQQGTTSNKKGLDPLWSLNHYQYLDNGLNHDKPLILSRYSGFGSHRYPLGFSGDTVISWKSLEYLPYFTLTSTNSGYTWWSHDIGGHYCGDKDDELYIRYLQYGVFSPINRLHCSNTPVIAKDMKYYGNGVNLIAKQWLRLRHKLIPYLQSANYRTHLFGEALIEPLYFYEPNKQKAYDYKTEYFFNGQLLVCPITKKSRKKGLATQKIYLPEGTWTDIFTNAVYQGGKEYQIVRSLENMPIFAKQGGTLVLSDENSGNSLANCPSLDCFIYNGNGKFTLYEDDDKDKVFTTNFVNENKGKKQTTVITFNGQKSVIPKNRKYNICFKNIENGEITVYKDGVIIAKQNCYNQTVYTLENADYGATYKITVDHAQKTQLEQIKQSAISDVMLFEGFNEKRQELYDTVLSASSVEDYAEKINVFFENNKKYFPDIYKVKLLEYV